MTPATFTARLWIDESGVFERRKDIVVVGGVLTEQSVSDHVVRRALRDQFPGFPWPLHAAHYKVPVFLALAHAVVPNPDPSVADSADTALASLAASALDQRDKVIDQIRNGVLPNYDDLASLDRALRNYVGRDRYTKIHESRLEAARDRMVESVRIVLRVVTEFSLGSVVAAVEPRRPPAAEVAGSTADDRDRFGSDRYLKLLAAVAKSTCRTRTRKGDSELPVQPVVLSRRVYRKKLSGEDVDKVFGPACPGGFAPTRVVFYHQHTRSCLILADFVVNACRRGLMVYSRNESKTRSIEAEVGIRPELEWVLQ